MRRGLFLDETGLLGFLAEILGGLGVFAEGDLGGGSLLAREGEPRHVRNRADQDV